MDDQTDGIGRRAVLRSAAGATAAGAGVAAASTTAAAQSVSEWLSDTSNYSGVVDRTGQDEVTVEVGVQANGGPYGYGPAAVRVDPGTTITFEWVSNTHNVLIESQPSGADWAGITDIHNEGYSASHTFETAGVHLYYCRPHERMGMKGAVVVGDVELGGGGGGGGLGLPAVHDGLLTLGGAVAMGVISPLLFALFLRKRAREGAL